VSENGKPEQFAAQHSVHNGMHEIALAGELDLACAPLLADLVRGLAEGDGDGVTAVTLDLRRLTFIDSTGVRATLSVRELCRARGYGFFVIPGPRQVQRVFEIAGLLEVLPFAQAPRGVEESPV
jgi:anti-sigma B factor antagonist